MNVTLVDSLGELKPRNESCKRVLIVCSGSVGAVKVPEIICSLNTFGFNVRYICSSFAASHFLQKSQYYNPSIYKKFIENKYNELIIEDKDEWTWDRIGDPVLHIVLRDWADILIIIPASADIIAKISTGICDTLALSVCRAWNFDKPFIICPAMNTQMFNHPVTQQSLYILQSWGCAVLEPVDKLLACGDRGKGALCTVDTIIKEVISVSNKLSSGNSNKVLIISHPILVFTQFTHAITVERE